MRDANARISVEEANQIAQERSGGKVSIKADGKRIMLCCEGSPLSVELHPDFDMTEAAIEQCVDEIM